MHRIVIQRIANSKFIPSDTLLKRWAHCALQNKKSIVEVTLRIVGKKEIQQLNYQFRQKNKPTNVLAFPFDEIDLDIPILGDIVLCAPIIKAEAKAQHKTVSAHWAHMIIHGMLHLLGYDHIQEKDAIKMEKQEIKLLSYLKFSNPYNIKMIGD